MKINGRRSNVRDFAYEAKTWGKPANVLTWGENIGFNALSILILTFDHGHCLLTSTGKFNVFVLTKQNVVHYSYAEQGYCNVSLSSSCDKV